MAKSKPVANIVNIVAWITGVLVALAVGFGMVDETLTIWVIPSIITIIAGWIVVILTIIGAVLAIANKL